MVNFENDPNIEKAISSSWAHWLYIHFVGEWYTEWPFRFKFNPFHSFSDRVNIDYKGQRFRVIQNLSDSIGFKSIRSWKLNYTIMISQLYDHVKKLNLPKYTIKKIEVYDLKKVRDHRFELSIMAESSRSWLRVYDLDWK